MKAKLTDVVSNFTCFKKYTLSPIFNYLFKQATLFWFLDQRKTHYTGRCN